MKYTRTTAADYSKIGLKASGKHQRVLCKVDDRRWYHKLFNMEPSVTRYEWVLPEDIK